MLTSIQLAGVTPELNLGFTQVKNHAKGSTLALKQGQTSPEVQNGSISGLTKRT